MTRLQRAGAHRRQGAVAGAAGGRESGWAPDHAQAGAGPRAEARGQLMARIDSNSRDAVAMTLLAAW